VDHQLQDKEIRVELGMVMLGLIGERLAVVAAVLERLVEMHQDQLQVEMVEQVHQMFMHLDHLIQFFMLVVVEEALAYLQEITLLELEDLEVVEMVVVH
jgi:hypothetical protein